MERLTRREAIKLIAVAGFAVLLSVLSGGIDPEEKIEQLEQPTEKPELGNAEKYYSATLTSGVQVPVFPVYTITPTFPSLSTEGRTVITEKALIQAASQRYG